MREGRMTVRVASPCSERWEQMEGDSRMRYCARCRLHVYNLSELTIGELQALVQRTEGRLCGRLYQRRDGTALTRDCPVGLRRARMRLGAAVTTAVALVGAVLLGSPRSAAASASRSPLAERMEQWRYYARAIPIIGNIISYIDPEPIMGAVYVPPPGP
jgi:hypothetical protein